MRQLKLIGAGVAAIVAILSLDTNQSDPLQAAATRVQNDLMMVQRQIQNQGGSSHDN